jgi:hypothetical protein
MAPLMALHHCGDAQLAVLSGGLLFLSWSRDEAVIWALLRWAAAGLATLGVGYQFWAAYRLISMQDEFVRALAAKRMLAAAGATLSFAVFWALGQQFLGLPTVPMWMLYPLFWGAFGLLTPFIKSSLP